MIKVIAVEKRSAAARAGILVGDAIISINGSPINDIIDLSYSSADETLVFKISRNDRILTVSAKNPSLANAGITIEPFRIRRCNNRCIFCFVDQMAPNLRSTLYIKDEDYRLSFLDGSYICATNLKETDFERIKKLHLSPLYISVHATDEKIRATMLSNNSAPPILSVIDKLISSSIQLHTQIVLCPKINDGPVLKKTLSDLALRHKNILSVAIVPVGLSAHRDKLPIIKPVTSDYAKLLIGKIKLLQISLRKKLGRNFIFLSDEFYIKANFPLPRQSHYGDFPQYENGVGMMRDFLFNFTRELLTRKKRTKRANSKRFAVLTGRSAYPFIRKLFSKLGSINGNKYAVFELVNTLLGDSVTVSGLLPGHEMARSMAGYRFNGALIPPNSINQDGLTIDGYSLAELSRITGIKFIAPSTFMEIPQ